MVVVLVVPVLRVDKNMKIRKNFSKIIIFLLYFTSLSGIGLCIKTKSLDYRIFSTESFDVYYSNPKIAPIFPFLENILEETFAKETDFFNVKIDKKIPFFVYYGKQDFFQNTIVDVTEGTGGVTEAYKNRFLVPFTGSKKIFQHVVNHEFVHEVEFNILYDGFWKTPLLLKSVLYPNWLLEGLAEYRSRVFVKTEQEMKVRDMAVSDKLIPIIHLHNFNHLKPYQISPAYEQSAKIIEYIAQEYGEKRVVDLLKVFRDKFDSDSVLRIVCGVNMKTLDSKFQDEMKMYYNYEIKRSSMVDFDIKNRITKPTTFPTYYYSPTVYKDNLIYLGDPDGSRVFFIKSIPEGKQKILLGSEKLKNLVDYIDTDRISVSLNGVLCFSGTRNNVSTLFLYEIKTGTIQKIVLSEVDFITSAYISPTGEFVAISGVKKSQPDVFLYNIKSGEIKQLTNDENYESQVIFSPSGKSIAYIKEIECEKNIERENKVLTYQTDVFVYNLEEGNEKRITATISDESYPSFISEDEILYVSDYNDEYSKNLYGVPNIFLHKYEQQYNRKVNKCNRWYFSAIFLQ